MFIRNKSDNELNRQRGHLVAITGPLLPSHADTLMTLAEPIDALVRAEVAAEVQSAIRQLDARSRFIVRRRMDGETFEAIGRHIGAAKQSVQRSYSRALNRLRPILSDVNQLVDRGELMSKPQRTI